VLCELQAVFFGFDSPQLTPETTDKLKAAAECIASQGRLVYLEAHADPRGTDEYNLALSDRRAESVALALTEYFDVPPENLVVQGYGEFDLKVPTQTAERENRRANVRRITGLLGIESAELR